MWLIPKGDLTPQHVLDVLKKKMHLSRFTAHLEVGKLGKNTPGVKVSCVRLKRKKPYCGAHPGPCLNTFRKHKNATWLEGLDWVGFNALVNDLLDELNAECDFFSYNRESLVGGRYHIRLGRRRRVGYPFSYRGNFAHWTQGDLEKDFEDHCGKPHPEVPWHIKDAGTPGYPCYSITEEEVYRAEEKENGGGAAA